MICHVTVMTEKLQETIDFYAWLLDLPVARRFRTGNGMEIAFLGAEETKFEIIYSPDYKTKPAEGVTIGFAAASLSEKIAMLEGKGIAHSPVISPNPSSKFCYFTDLNGVQIQLFESQKQ
jgi:lactoylglutathione lyase